MAQKTITPGLLTYGGVPKSVKNAVGQKFAMLTVLEFAGTYTSARQTTMHFVWCRCECGKRHMANVAHLRRGGTKSCGCAKSGYIARSRTKHGHSPLRGVPTRTYRSWRAMCRRCSAPADSSYQHYGGRGITVCDRWKDFRNFLADMGEAPAGTSIERVDNSLGYSPENCRWATPAEQSRNTRRNWQVSVRGEVMTPADAIKRYGLTNTRLYKHLYRTNADKGEVIPIDDFPGVEQAFDEVFGPAPEGTTCVTLRWVEKPL